MGNIKFNLTAATDVGLHRVNNEDNFIVSTDLSKSEWYVPQEVDQPMELNDKGILMVVADGMGGMNAGEVASGIAVDTIQKCFLSDQLEKNILKDSESRKQYIKEAIILADGQIKSWGKDNREAYGMGTTVVLLWILKDKAYIAWCGDSRAYSYHPQEGLRQLTKDHSYVQELVDQGKLEAEYMFDHPGNNIITRSLGDPNKVAAPDFIEYDLCDGEIILLCSDGLSGMLRDEQINHILSQEYQDLNKCKTVLIESALDAGGDDNITVALCKIISGSNRLTPSKGDIQTSNSIRINRRSLGKIIVLISFLLILFGGLGWYLGNTRGDCLNKEIDEMDITILDNDTFPKNEKKGDANSSSIDSSLNKEDKKCNSDLSSEKIDFIPAPKDDNVQIEEKKEEPVDLENNILLDELNTLTPIQKETLSPIKSKD